MTTSNTGHLGHQKYKLTFFIIFFFGSHYEKANALIRKIVLSFSFAFSR